MTGEVQPDWLLGCQEEGIDPGEVRLVYQRYEAYRGFYLQGRGEPLSLEAWFNCYRIETASEATAQSKPSPSGCSVDDGSHNRGVIRKPEAFLKVLRRLAGAQPRM